MPPRTVSRNKNEHAQTTSFSSFGFQQLFDHVCLATKFKHICGDVRYIRVMSNQSTFSRDSLICTVLIAAIPISRCIFVLLSPPPQLQHRCLF